LPGLEKSVVTQDKTTPPSTRVRLAWWFSIYVSALVPFVRAVCSEYPPFNIVTAVFFPLPLGFLLAPLVNLMPYSFGRFFVPILFIAGPAFYVLHLRSTLKASTLWRFDWLLLMLVIVVLANQFLMATMATSIHM
jgi:hypothetical protein